VHWGSEQQEELRNQVTYHAYLASRVTVTHTKCWSCSLLNSTWNLVGTRLPGDKAFLLVFLWYSTNPCLLCRELAGTDVIMSPARRSVRLAERGVKCSAEKMVLPSLTQVPDDVDFAYCPNNALLWSLWSLIMKDLQLCNYKSIVYMLGIILYLILCVYSVHVCFHCSQPVLFTGIL